jgi:hypothetical protein
MQAYLPLGLIKKRANFSHWELKNYLISMKYGNVNIWLQIFWKETIIFCLCLYTKTYRL